MKALPLLLITFVGCSSEPPDHKIWTINPDPDGRCEVSHITGNSAVVDVKKIYLKIDYGVLSVDIDFDQPALPRTKTRRGFFLASPSTEFKGDGHYDFSKSNTLTIFHDGKEYCFFERTDVNIAFGYRDPHWVHYRQVVKTGFDINELRDKLEQSEEFWDKVHLDYLKDFNERGERVLVFWGKYE